MALAPGRSLAWRAIGRARRTHGWVRDSLREVAHSLSASERDRALAWRISMGATLAKGHLEARVLSLVRKPSSLEPRVRDALILGAYEIGYLSTPIGVAVSQWVDAVGSTSPRAIGLANAVLRKLSPLRSEVLGARSRVVQGTLSVDDLELCSGLPEWLCARFLDERGSEASATIALGLAEAAPAWLVGVISDARMGVLEDAGLEPKAEALPGIWRLGNPARLESSHVLERGFCPEDLSAFEIALASVPKPGGSRLEVGVGRGTKALVAATLSSERGALGRFVCVDASAERVLEARDRFARAGLPATLVHGEGRDLEAHLGDERFSMVFVDAPCSGTGTMRRHPEIAWNLDPSSVEAPGHAPLPQLQLELLEEASRHVEEDGYLLYATCSALREENGQVVEAFLSGEAGSRFERAGLDELPVFAQLGKDAQDRLKADGFFGSEFSTKPVPEGPDLHYLAALRRVHA